MPPKKQASGVLQQQYEALVTRGEIKDDQHQREVLAGLEQLLGQLKPRMRLFGKPAARGIYLWGEVGRGKSMLMDLFFNRASVEKKRRVHFHAFMQEVHARIHELRKTGIKTGDPVIVLAKQLSEETSLLCFDELQATDVADATLLYRLFDALFEAGVIIVSTSNHPPASLYTGGVQRERFDKFIALLEEHMEVLSLSSPSDYRHMQAKALQTVYFHPLGSDADAFIEDTIAKLCPGAKPTHATLAVQGRKTQFMLYDKTVGRFSFHDLCETAMGAADYLALAKRLDTLILTDIPALPAEKRNEAKRFVTLIDALYEHKVMLIATAAVPAANLYPDGDGSFEFHRTVSRLAEMQSEIYLNG